MNNYRNLMKPCAIVLCVLYLVFVVFLPYVVFSGDTGLGFKAGLDLKFSNIISGTIDMMGARVDADGVQSTWIILPLIAGIGMVLASALLPGKKAAVVCIIGAFIALIAFWLVRGDMADGYSEVKEYLKIGSGPILALICGIAAAAVCWLSESMAPRREITPGVDSGNGDEW